MKILVHDYSGHPFQAELSRDLARRGHQVTHSWCEAHVSGKGDLAARPTDNLEFRSIAAGETIDKLSFASRLVKELRYGAQLVRLTRRVRPEVVLVGNAPVPMLAVYALYLASSRTPWVHWQQDVQGVAARSFAGRRLPRAFVLVAHLMEVVERLCTRLARHTVVISESFVEVHRRWRTAHKVSVIPNWAPIDEIRPVSRSNDWALEHGLADTPTLLYSGTLGLKHNPALLVQLARRVIDSGRAVQLVVVTEGPAAQLVRDEVARLDVPALVLPFQPYARLSEVLGSGDVLLVLLDATAGTFSVPSKTLSYLCAGRPILGLMPEENQAARLVQQCDGCVLPPDEDSLDAAARWLVDVLGDAQRREAVGGRARALAEQEFALNTCADKFESILSAAAMASPSSVG